MSLVGTLAKVAVGAMVAKGVGGMMRGGSGGGGGGLGGLLGAALGGKQGQSGGLGDLLSGAAGQQRQGCLLYTSPSPRDRQKPRMPSSA